MSSTKVGPGEGELRWEPIPYVAAKSGRLADSPVGRFTVRRSTPSARTFLVRHNNVLAKASFTSIEDGMAHAQGWYAQLLKEQDNAR